MCTQNFDFLNKIPQLVVVYTKVCLQEELVVVYTKLRRAPAGESPGKGFGFWVGLRGQALLQLSLLVISIAILNAIDVSLQLVFVVCCRPNKKHWQLRIIEDPNTSRLVRGQQLRLRSSHPHTLHPAWAGGSPVASDSPICSVSCHLVVMMHHDTRCMHLTI